MGSSQRFSEWKRSLACVRCPCGTNNVRDYERTWAAATTDDIQISACALYRFISSVYLGIGHRDFRIWSGRRSGGQRFQGAATGYRFDEVDIVTYSHRLYLLIVYRISTA